MSLTIILLLVAAGAFILPNIGGDDDDDGKNTVNGTPEDDMTLEGSEGNDLIRGFAGEDTINGNGGNDEIYGNADNDIINGGTGLDFVRGGPGDDIIDGGEGNDRLISDSGNDTVYGGFGSDIIRGGEGNDTIYGGFNDTIYGGFDSRLQDDGSVVANVSATDAITGEEGEDTIFIWGGDSVANGAEDDDELILMTGTGTFLDGGGTNDFYAFANLTDDQDTFVIIDDFSKIDEDTLTLTIDVSEVPDFENTGFEIVLENTQVDGVNGMLVTVNLTEDEPGQFTGDFEEASAFIVGADAEDFSPSDFDVVWTENADLFDADATLADVKAGGIPQIT